MYSSLKIIALSGLSILAFLSDSAVSIPSINHSTSEVSQNNFENIDIEETARQISVRIFKEGEPGSGVIVARKGNTYTVITNAHVLGDDVNQNYRVMTAEGVIHQARLLPCNCFAELDLAMVTFESSENYTVAEFNQNRVMLGERLYSAGFPGYHYPNSKEIQSTENWGTRAFMLSSGQASFYTEKPLLQGYQLGYTNDVREGMSGGPVIDEQGKLVGLNGRLRYPIQGRSAFIYTDGTQASPEIFQQIESLSWAIPVSRFQHLFNKNYQLKDYSEKVVPV